MSLSRVGLIIVALAAAVGGVFAFFRAIDERSAPPILIEDAAATWPVVVDVRGAVIVPGVYELPPGARVQDAVAAAGGLAADADLSTINLARRLRDGEVVAVADQAASLASPIVAPLGGDTELTDAAAPKININLASADELEQLPGIGETLAARIVAFRDERGPYRSVDDLIHVDGISMRTIEALRNLVTTAP